MNPELLFFRENSSRAQELLDLLRGVGIDVTTGSDLESAILEIFNMAYLRDKTTSFDNSLDHADQWRKAISLSHLVRHLLRLRLHQDFEQLVPHLRLLAVAGSVAQNARASITDSASNKLFEFLLAMAAMSIGKDTRLDDPDHSRGNNPDILTTFENRRWGIACKAIHTRNVVSYVENVEKAVEQIGRSEATNGLVCISLKNIFPHEEIFAASKDEEGEFVYPSFQTEGAARDAVLRSTLKVVDSNAISKELERRGVISAMRTRGIIPGVARFVGTMASIQTPQYPALFTSFNLLNFQQLDELTVEETEFLLESTTVFTSGDRDPAVFDRGAGGSFVLLYGQSSGCG